MTERMLMQEKAQSLTELALIGSIILSILGVLLTYGLRYNYQQQVAQEAFRKAVADASRERPLGNPSGTSSYVLYKDRHIPDPSDPFAVGQIVSPVASYSITRSYNLQETPDTISELPSIVLDIQNHQYRFYTAGFATYCGDPAKYKAIFGDGNVWDSGGCSRVIDSCEGEIIDYSTCKSQCRMFTDAAYCTNRCRLGGSSNCDAVCASGATVPPYCNALDSIFSFYLVDHKPSSMMGVSSDTVEVNQRNNVMYKNEIPGKVVTTDAIAWVDTMNRKIIYKPFGSLSAVTMPVATTAGDNEVVTMSNN